MRQTSSTVCRVVRVAVFLIALLGLRPVSALAQQLGMVTGRVTGPNGNPVGEATVSVAGTMVSGTTDHAGVFRLQGVPLGPQTVTVRHLGLRAATQSVYVTAAVPARISVALELAPVALAGITVTGERGGQIRSAEQERRSSTVMDVVSADEIGTLPDQNVAEAVQRVSGVFMETSRGEGRTVSIRGVAPNLNNVTLNGQPLASTATDRATALDLLPASMVSSIEVIKAVTPDMDANTIGGTVNLRTLTAFDRPGAFFSGSAEGLLHNRQVDYGDRKTPYELDLTAGRRFGPSNTFGLVVSGSASRRDNSVSVLDPDGWVKSVNKMGGDTLNVSDEIELQVADNDRDRYGITAGLDWRPTPETNMFVRGLYTHTRELERNSEFEITFTGDYEFATPKAGRNTKGSLELDLSQAEEKEQLYSFNLGGGHRWGALTMDVSGLVTRGEAERVGPDATFENPQATEPQAAIKLDFNPYFFSVTPENPSFVANPANYNLNGLSYNTRNTVENTYIGAADWRLDTRLGRFPGFVKFGAKVQLRDKDIDESSERYTNPALTLAPWSMPVVGGLQGAASPFVHGNVDQFVDFIRRNRSGSDSLTFDGVNTSVQAIDNDAYVKERVTAGYLMGTAEMGRLTLIAGVRAENTNSDAEFYELRENSRLPVATRYDLPESLSTARHNYTHWLPSAILKLDLTDGLVLRAAYTSTIGRPQYTQLAGYTRANYLPDPTNPNVFDGTISASNPNLMPYESSNYDLSAEYYLPTGGQLSAGGFYKRVDNPIYNFSSTERNVTHDSLFFTTLKYSQLRNGDAGKFGGIELAYSQPLYFLPGPLNGLGITTNLALINSELTVVGRDDKLPFLGQPDRVINLIPYYQRGPFEVRFAYARRSAYLTAVEEPGLDRFVDARETMDLTVRYQLMGRGMELIGTARNLANAPEVRYQGNRSQYDLHVLTGRTFSIGVRTTR